MAHFMILFNIFILMQFQYVAINSFQLAQSNSMNVQGSQSPVGVSIDKPAKMIFYVNGPGMVRALLPIDIEVMPLQNFRNQLATNVAAQNGIYMNSQFLPPGIQYAPPLNPYRWNPRPFPRLAPQDRPQIATLDRYYDNVNTPSRVVQSAKPWIAPTQPTPLETTTLDSNTFVSTTIATTTVEIATTSTVVPTEATPTTTAIPEAIVLDEPVIPKGIVLDEPVIPKGVVLDEPVIPKGIVLDEPSEKLPETADKLNENEFVHSDIESIKARNSSPTTEPTPLIDKVMYQQPPENDIEDMSHTTTTEQTNQLPSALPIDEVPAEKTPPESFEAVEETKF